MLYASLDTRSFPFQEKLRTSPAPGTLGSGYNASSLGTSGSQRSLGMVLLGKFARLAAAGSLTGLGKIPSLSGSVGTLAVCGAAFTSRELCQLPKKNVRSLITGPPMVAPNWFWMNCGFAVPA